MLTDPYYDPLLMGSPLRRRGVCRLISAALLALLAFATLIQLSVLVSMRPDITGVFLKALMLSSLLAVAPLAILWFLDRRERETPWLFAAAFLWGGCIATALAVPFNTAFFTLVDAWVAQHPAITLILGSNASLMLAAPISAPIVEEIAKAAGVLVIFWLLRAEFDNMRDGLVYGGLVGLGFNWWEAALYVAQGYAQSEVAPYGTQLGARFALVGLGGHAMFTGMFGASLGLAIQTKHRWLRVLAPIVGIALAIAAHMLNNALPLIIALAGAAEGEFPGEYDPPADIGFLDGFLSGSLTQLALFLPFLLIMVLALWRSGVWERRVIREELAGEVGRVVSPSEYQEIARDRIFHTRRVKGMGRRASAALVNAQNELAFRKRRVREEGKDPEQDRLANNWRGEIRRLRTTVVHD
jgi:protease PrsW